MGLLSWLTSTPKAVENILDKDKGLLTQVGAWVGGMNFTEEEHAEYRIKVADKAADFVGRTLEENTERSKSRRAVADLWIKVQLCLVLMVAITLPFDDKLAEGYWRLATSDIMMWGTGSIIVFFFGGYVWGAHIAKRK